MTTSETRLALKDAITGIAGCKGYLYRPTAPNAGDAWPMWRGFEVDDDGLPVHTWVLVVAVPADEQAASTFADAHMDEIAAALAPVMFVSACEPASIPSSGGDMYGLQFTGRTE
jgi:hypothetical protein